MRALALADNALSNLFVRHGQHYTWAPRPTGVRKGRSKQCYYNAYWLALRRPDLHLTYVEGYFDGIPHAWCVTVDGLVVDPTLANAGTDTEYFGVPFKTEWISRLDWPGGIFARDKMLDFSEIAAGVKATP